MENPWNHIQKNGWFWGSAFFRKADKAAFHLDRHSSHEGLPSSNICVKLSQEMVSCLANGQGSRVAMADIKPIRLRKQVVNVNECYMFLHVSTLYIYIIFIVCNIFSTFNRHLLFIFCKNHCRVVLVQPGAWSCIPEIMGFMMGVANFRTPPQKAGWWFGTMEFYDFPSSWECHHPNCLSLHHFSKGLKEPPTSI